MKFTWEVLLVSFFLVIFVTAWFVYAIKKKKLVHVNATIYHANEVDVSFMPHGNQLVSISNNKDNGGHGGIKSKQSKNRASNLTDDAAVASDNPAESDAVAAATRSNADSNQKLDIAATPLVVSRFLSIPQLSFVRLVIGLYCFFVLIWGSTDAVASGLPLYAMYSFYTVWNWCIVTLYFLLSSLLGLMGVYCGRVEWIQALVPSKTWCGSSADASGARGSDIDAGESVGRMQVPGVSGKYGVFVACGQQVVWVLFQVECGLSLLVTLTVWCLLYWTASKEDRDGLLNFTNINMHVFNVVFMYFDLSLTGVPVLWHNGVFVVLLSAFYLSFSWVYYSVTHFWDYFFLDTSVAFDAVMYLILFLVHIVSYGAAWYVARCRDRIGSNAHGGKHNLAMMRIKELERYFELKSRKNVTDSMPLVGGGKV